MSNNNNYTTTTTTTNDDDEYFVRWVFSEVIPYVQYNKLMSKSRTHDIREEDLYTQVIFLGKYYFGDNEHYVALADDNPFFRFLCESDTQFLLYSLMSYDVNGSGAVETSTDTSINIDIDDMERLKRKNHVDNRGILVRFFDSVKKGFNQSHADYYGGIERNISPKTIFIHGEFVEGHLSPSLYQSDSTKRKLFHIILKDHLDKLVKVVFETFTAHSNKKNNDTNNIY